MYPLMLCFLHSTHLTLGLVLEAGPVKTPIVFFGGESIAGNRWTESATYWPWRYTEICGCGEKENKEDSFLPPWTNPDCIPKYTIFTRITRFTCSAQWWIQVPEDLNEWFANHYYWHGSLSQKPLFMFYLELQFTNREWKVASDHRCHEIKVQFNIQTKPNI